MTTRASVSWRQVAENATVFLLSRLAPGMTALCGGLYVTACTGMPSQANFESLAWITATLLATSRLGFSWTAVLTEEPERAVVKRGSERFAHAFALMLGVLVFQFAVLRLVGPDAPCRSWTLAQIAVTIPWGLSMLCALVVAQQFHLGMLDFAEVLWKRGCTHPRWSDLI